MSASVGRLAAGLLIETESVLSAERWANEMTDPGSSGGHSQSCSSSAQERGEERPNPVICRVSMPDAGTASTPHWG